MESSDDLKMSSLGETNLGDENSTEGLFDDNENGFDEKSSLVSHGDSDLENAAKNTKTIDMDRSLYMENTVS